MSTRSTQFILAVLIVLIAVPSLKSQQKKVPKGISTETVEECYYDRNDDYVCRDVVKQRPAEAGNVQAGSTKVNQQVASTPIEPDMVEGQKSPEDLKKLDYEHIARRRDALQESIGKLTDRLNALRDIKMSLSQLSMVDRGMQAEIKRYIAETEIVVGLGQDQAYNPSALDTLTRSTEKTIQRQRQELKDIDSEIGTRLNIEAQAQKFKQTISKYFSYVVGAVIVLFFAVAFSDSEVRRRIFTGQSGIQFITLFSLVIAIILFGITGVLEGKELSALLGGIAGYILGKSGTAAPSKTAQKPSKEGPPAGQGGTENGKEEAVELRPAA